MTARTTVKTKPQRASSFKPAVIAWCAYVIVAPDVNKITVLTRGTSIQLKVWIPFGGQILPISIVGVKLAAKKCSKKSEKEHYFRNDK